jgi:hypothetical protein
VAQGRESAMFVEWNMHSRGGDMYVWSEDC